MTILFNLDQLNELSQSIPYNVMCIVDPSTIIFPAVIKFILLEREDGAVVYAVPFDTNDLLTFYETVAARINTEKPGIEGYNYAESTPDESTQGTSEPVQADVHSDL